jgi:hypothetical protein
MLKQHRLIEEVTHNCISKLSNCPIIDSRELIKNIPIIVEKVDKRMKLLHLAE